MFRIAGLDGGTLTRCVAVGVLEGLQFVTPNHIILVLFQKHAGSSDTCWKVCLCRLESSSPILQSGLPGRHEHVAGPSSFLCSYPVPTVSWSCAYILKCVFMEVGEKLDLWFDQTWDEIKYKL